MQGGALCISIDFELLWGVHDHLSDDYVQSAKRVRYVVKELLRLFKKYDVGATWATVGHLFLTKCDGKHKELGLSEDWFKNDPGTNVKKDSLWYGPDMIKQIKANKKQEIGSHSFSHIEYGNVSSRTAEKDLQECIKLAKKEKLEITSFVFPRNNVGHLDLLEKYKIKTYRPKDNYPLTNVPIIGKLLLLLHILLVLPPPTRKPYFEINNVLAIPGSMIFLSRDGFRKHIPMSCRVKKAMKGIDKAMKTDTVFHLWFHPINFGSDVEEMLKGFEKVLKYAKKKKIRVLTMKQIYDEMKEE